MSDRETKTPDAAASGDPQQTPLPTRRSLRQHRRVDSAAGAPTGRPAGATILELPASTVSPSDVGPLTGPLPTAPDDDAALPPGTRVDHDGVPVGPDGHPLSRRELRELRRRQDEPDAGPAPVSISLRAEAPAGAPGAAEPVSRDSLAAEGAALAARVEESGTDDPTAVDPELLREQELLAERARQLNTGMITRVPVPGAAAGAGVAGGADPAPTTAAAKPATAKPAAAKPAAAGEPGREPVQAQSAHGLDSMGASAWTDRERTLMLVAAAVILVLLIALILSLVL